MVVVNETQPIFSAFCVPSHQARSPRMLVQLLWEKEVKQPLPLRRTAVGCITCVALVALWVKQLLVWCQYMQADMAQGYVSIQHCNAISYKCGHFCNPQCIAFNGRVNRIILL